MNFLEKYFLHPIQYQGKYNVVNTLTYSTLFIVLSYLLYKYLKSSGVSIDRNLILSAIPYIFLGILLRVQVDYGFLQPSIITVTPGVWFISLGLWIIQFLISRKLSISNYQKYIFYSGIIILFISFLCGFKIYLTNIPMLVVYASLLLPLVLFFIKDVPFYFLAIYGELIDALSSYIAIKHGFSEEHVVSSILVSISPELFFITKMVATIIIVYLIERFVDEIDLKNYIYIVVFILGFGPGTRNWLLLIGK